MVDQQISHDLDRVSQASNTLFTSEREEKKIERIEDRLNTLLGERGNLSTSEVVDLRNEAAMYDKLASQINQLADKMEQGINEEEIKDEVQKVTETLMEEFGIPRAFAEQLAAQLGLLAKGGPRALRDGAAVYRDKANRLREEAEFNTLQIQKIDREIKILSELRAAVRDGVGSEQRSMAEYLADLRYRESLRDHADEELKEALQKLEGQGEYAV